MYSCNRTDLLVYCKSDKYKFCEWSKNVRWIGKIGLLNAMDWTFQYGNVNVTCKIKYSMHKTVRKWKMMNNRDKLELFVMTNSFFI